MQDEESSSPQRRFIRQQWEAAMAATRVAIDSLREFWPIDADLTSACEDDAISMALRELEEAYVRLSMLNQSMLGVALAGVLSGMITDSEHLEAVLGEE